MTPLRIGYESEGFPPRTTLNGPSQLTTTWGEILGAALTIGRPSWHDVFQHGVPSLWEARFRLSLVRMALEQAGPCGYRFRLTNAANALDPTEKGAVSYFLGMAFCKLFAEKLLGTPWLLHLDIWRTRLDAALKGRSRPDLIGLEPSTKRWHAFECKGRISPPGTVVKQAAKDQASRVVSVDSVPCDLHIGAVTYFRNDVLHFYWRDPDPPLGTPIEVPFGPDAWRHYYGPVLALLEHADGRALVTRDAERFTWIAEADLEIGVHPAVAGPLSRRDWGAAFQAAVEARAEILQAGYSSDGLAVRAGPSWREPFSDPRGRNE